MRVEKPFFCRDVLEVAPNLLGKIIAKRNFDISISRYRITEVEAYRGEEDLACHASKGRTSRTEVMYADGGLVYVYLIYGMYWMLNIVTGEPNSPQAVLIRGIDECTGPGRVSRILQIDKTFYGEDITTSHRIWIEDEGTEINFETGQRIGVDYAGEYWAAKPWRFWINNKLPQ
jgi:DNA-3-methyladenine glycosylase